MTLRRLLITILAWAAGALVFFHDQLLSGFRWIGGDIADMRIHVFLAEHWRRVLTGATGAWLDPPYFHPTPHAIAYTDATFALALPHMLFRALGCDELLAFQLAVIATSLAGVLGFTLLALTLLRVPFPIALAAALGFTFSNMNYAKTGHPVHAMVWLLPFLVVCAARAATSLAERFVAAVAWGIAAAVLLALIALTAFGVAWFAVVLALVAGLAMLALEPARVREGLRAIGPGRLAGFAAIVLVALAVAFAPFVAIFLPALLAGAERSYAEVRTYTPGPLALTDFGGSNLLWGWLTQALDSTRTAVWISSEESLALTPAVAVLAIIVVVWLWRRRRGGAQDARTADPRTGLLLAAGLAVVIISPLLLKVGTHSLWRYVWTVVPGARAIRTPFRFQLVLALPVWVLLAYGGAQLRQYLAHRRSPAVAHAVVGALAVLVLAEQVNLTPVAWIDRPAELARLARIAPPPPACQSFYIQSDEPRGLGLQTDAMMIALRVGLPTINGLSGTFPPWWEEHLLHVDRPDYRTNVAAWAEMHGLAATLCGVALPESRWIPPGG
jgi:hypothetical protein